jgi:hypothetical protein
MMLNQHHCADRIHLDFSVTSVIYWNKSRTCYLTRHGNPAAAQAELSRLRRDIARIEGRLAEEDRRRAVLGRAVRFSPALEPKGERRGC